MKDGRATVDALVSLTGFSLVGGPAYNDAQRRRGHAGAARRALPRRAPGRVPDARPMGRVRARPAAGREHDDGRDPGTRRRHRPDGVRRPRVRPDRLHGCTHCTFATRASASDMHACTSAPTMLAARVAQAGRPAPLASARSARSRWCCSTSRRMPATPARPPILSVFESLLQHAAGAAGARATRVDVPAERRRPARTASSTATPRRFGAEANVHTRIAGRRPRAPRALAEARSRRSGARRPAGSRATAARSSCSARSSATCSSACSRPSATKATRCGCCSRRASRRPTPSRPSTAGCARISAPHAVLHFGTHGALEFMPGKQTGMSGDVLARPADRRPAEHLPLCLEQPVRRHDRQAPRRRDADQLPDAAGGARRALSRPASTSRRRSTAGARWTRTRTRERADAGRADPGAGRRARTRRQPSRPGTATREPRSARLRRRGARTRIHADPARPARRRPAPSPQSAPTCCWRWPRHRTACAGSATRSRRWSTAHARSRAAAAHRRAEQLATLRELARPTGCWRRTTSSRHPARARRPLRAPGAGRRPAAHAGDPADRPQPARLRSVPHPERLRGAGRRAPGRAAARAAHARTATACPRSIALVLWGTDNLKTEGGPIAPGAGADGRARRASTAMAACAGAELMPLAELGRPRIDVVITLSGIFRDLLPLQIKLLAEAAFLAASADEPVEHELRPQARAGLPGRSTAATSRRRRCASSATPTAPTAPTSITWSTAAAGTTRTNWPRPITRRKGFAYGRDGRPVQQAALLQSVLAGVRPRLPEPRLGRTRRHHGRHYFDTLGGISRAVQRAKRRRQRRRSISATRRAASGTVRTLAEQVALETRTRMLNPKWYEGMLKHGYEGVRQIEAHVTNTMGWSATTGQVAALGLPAADRDLRARPRDARAPGRSSTRRRPRKVANRLLEAHRAQVLDARRRRCSMRCGAPAKNSKTDSKAIVRRSAAA